MKEKLYEKGRSPVKRVNTKVEIHPSKIDFYIETWRKGFLVTVDAFTNIKVNFLFHIVPCQLVKKGWLSI